jgi:hypothetical protein
VGEGSGRGVLTAGRAPDHAAPASAGSPGKAVRKSTEQLELEKLRRRNNKLESDLAKTRMALDIMGKAHALLERLSESAENNDPPRTS